MVALAESELITVWERTWNHSSAEKALALLQLSVDVDLPTLAKLSVGQRDRMLIDLRRRLFGDRLPMVVQCQACSAQMELELDTEQLLFDLPDQKPDLLMFEHDGVEVNFRLPNSADLIALSNNSENRPRELLARCIESVSKDGNSLQSGELSDSTLHGLIEAMETADPQANVEVPVTCVDCSQSWNAVFDIVSYLWNEIDAWAKRTLNEIHLLASAYGWSEQEILKLSSSRRQLYVNLVRQ